MKLSSQQKNILILCGFLAVLLLIGLAFQFLGQKFWPQKPEEKVEIKEVEYQHKDTTMGEVVKQDTNLKILENYYFSHEPKRGDLVVVKLEGRNDFIRKIVAVPGDKIDFEEANLKINIKIIKNSAGDPYLVADTKRESLKGKVPEDSYFVLSDESTPAAFDSREFGFVKKENLKGYIQK